MAVFIARTRLVSVSVSAMPELSFLLISSRASRNFFTASGSWGERVASSRMRSESVSVAPRQVFPVKSEKIKTISKEFPNLFRVEHGLFSVNEEVELRCRNRFRRRRRSYLYCRRFGEENLGRHRIRARIERFRAVRLSLRDKEESSHWSLDSW